MTTLWAGFLILVCICLALDLNVFHRAGAESGGIRRALKWSAVWISTGAAFSAVIYWIFESGFAGETLDPAVAPGGQGAAAALLYLEAFLLEKSLSVDNLFVIALVFRSFKIPKGYQHRVLYWGILGAVITRGMMIGGGLALISRFEWLFWVFGAYLAYSGLKILISGEEDEDPSESRFYQLMTRVIPVSKELDGEHFTTRIDGKRMFTPLFLVLVIIEGTDVMFAFDSVPAVLGISRNAYVIYTSNIFAVLGLRALYSVLVEMMDQFEYLATSIAVILIFVGVKLILHVPIELGDFHLHIEVPNGLGLGVILVCLTAGVGLSLLKRTEAEDAEGDAAATGDGAD